MKHETRNLKQKKLIHASRFMLHERGFTLIEMLVVIFIIAMIATISVANFRSAEKLKRVVIASDTVVNAVRNAQNFALTGRKTNNANAACRTPLYYYFYINYVGGLGLYAYNNCLANEIIETYALPANTRVKAGSLKVNGATVNNTFLALYFNPPFAKMTAYGDITPFLTTFSTVTITVESTDGAVSKIITIDGIAGRIGE